MHSGVIFWAYLCPFSNIRIHFGSDGPQSSLYDKMDINKPWNNTPWATNAAPE